MSEVSKRRKDSLDHRSQREITNTITHSKEKSVQDDIRRGDEARADQPARSKRGEERKKRERTLQPDALDPKRHREVTNTGGRPSRD